MTCFIRTPSKAIMLESHLLGSRRCNRIRPRLLRQTFSTVSSNASNPILAWASANPEIAQKCLEQPPFLNDKENMPSIDIPHSFEHYLQQREWSHCQPDHKLHFVTTLLTSHILSAPLTLADFLVQIEASTTTTEDVFRVCCPGARAESKVPLDYWKECLWMWKKNINNKSSTGASSSASLDFCGPDISLTTPTDQIVSLSDDHDDEASSATLTLRCVHQGLLHELEDWKPNEWDAFVFYNPGFGHPHLCNSWLPSLKTIFLDPRVTATSVPILLTAHSAQDASRDQKLLQTEFGLDVTYKPNPFASRMVYQDPFDEEHDVSPNAFVAHIVR